MRPQHVGEKFQLHHRESNPRPPPPPAAVAGTHSQLTCCCYAVKSDKPIEAGGSTADHSSDSVWKEATFTKFIRRQ